MTTPAPAAAAAAASPAPDDGAGPGSSRTDFHLGVAVTIVAALVAIVNLVNGRFSDDELVAVNEKVSAYAWYHSKGIKGALESGQRDMLTALVAAGAVADDRRGAVDELVRSLDHAAQRHETEKRAILSGGVVDGAAFAGARTFEQSALSLSRTGDVLDIAELLLHLALLLGGVGVAVQHKAFERAILKIVVALAATGALTAIGAIAVAFVG